MGWTRLRMPKNTALTIGSFDGVHRGHQDILKAARRTADKLGAFDRVTLIPIRQKFCTPSGRPAF